MDGARVNPWTSGPALVGYACLAEIALLLAFLAPYGIFRDELYYLACADHLAWGYVDHPPLSIFVLRLWTALFGDSLASIRVPPLLFGAGTIWLTGAIARELGGGRTAQGLAALAALLAPVVLAQSTFYSMNAIDLALWAAVFFLVARLVRTGRDRLWLPIGALIGLAYLNKLTAGVFDAALIAGLALTPHRKAFRDRWFWAGVGAGTLIVLPHLVWQAASGFPTIEFVAAAKAGKMTGFSLGPFLSGQLLLMGPVAALLLVAGIAFLLVSKEARPYRLLGISACAVFAAFVAVGGKSYYFAPVYAVGFAAGAVAVERFAAGRRGLAALVAAAIGLTGLVPLPIAVPVLSPERLAAYSSALGLSAPADEKSQVGLALPQHLADRFGWPEMAEAVASVYDALPAGERARCAVFAFNYGRAGAIDRFGPALGLPRALSGHNSYWLWGPGDWTSDCVIAVGGSADEFAEAFADVKQSATIDGPPEAVPCERGVPVFVCRGAKEPIDRLWPLVRNYQ